MANIRNMLRLIILLFLFIQEGRGTAQTWDWSTSLGGTATDALTAMEIGEDGNLFVAGSYQDEIAFGSTNLASIGEGDVFLAQLSESGNVEWAISGGSESNDNSLALTLDADGNILWLGQYWVRAFFGTDSIDSGMNSKAYFLAKYTPSGELLWLRNIRGTSTKVVADVSVDEANDIYLTGYFSDSLFLEEAALEAEGGEDAFLWKLNASGEVLWGTRYGNSGRIRPVKMESTPSGEVVIAGDIEGSVTFGEDELNSVTTDFDVFVAKIDGAGVPIWGRLGTGVFDDFLRALRVDESGNTYLSGHFIGVLNILGNTIATPGFVDNLFLIKLDAAGAVTWLRALDASEFNEPSFSFDIALREDKVWMTGQFLELLLIDDLTVSGEGYFQGFVAAFDTLEGAAEDLVLIPGDNQTSGRLLEVGMDNQVYLGGVFVEGLSLGNDNYQSSGGTDIFLARLGDALTSVAFPSLLDPRIKIYPNPVEETLYLNLPGSAEMELTVYDTKGNAHLRVRNTSQLSLEHLTTGLYYLQVKSRRYTQVLSFVKL